MVEVNNFIGTPQMLSEIGINGEYYSKGQIIRLVQLQRGDDPCFATDKRYTCTEICEWGRECRKLVAQWQR